MKKKIIKAYKRFIWRQFIKLFSHRIKHISVSKVFPDHEIRREKAEKLERIAANELAQMLGEYIIETDVMEMETKVHTDIMATEFVGHVYIFKK